MLMKISSNSWAGGVGAVQAHDGAVDADVCNDVNDVIDVFHVSAWKSLIYFIGRMCLDDA